jgi:hypothetical protein
MVFSETNSAAFCAVSRTNSDGIAKTRISHPRISLMSAVKLISGGSFMPGNNFAFSPSRLIASISLSNFVQAVTSCPLLHQSAAKAAPNPQPSTAIFAINTPPRRERIYAFLVLAERINPFPTFYVRSALISSHFCL